jgi:hypothetical protein
MLLKVIGKTLGTAKRVQKSHWEMPKDYWIASGQFLEVLESAGKCPNSRPQPIGDEAELLSSYWLKHSNFHPFPLKLCISVYIY